MKKYMAFYIAPTAELDKMMKTMTPEMGQEFDKQWTEWMTKMGSALVEKGEMLGKNKRVSSAGVADVRNELTGYSIVQAESHEAAAELFTGNPMFSMPGSYVDVVAMNGYSSK